jgi:hypothetical protein
MFIAVVAAAMQAGHLAGSGSWAMYAVSALGVWVFSGATLFVYWMIGRWQGGGEGPGGGEGGGGDGGWGRGRTPPKGSPPMDPEWWPEFERQFAAHVVSHSGQRDSVPHV